ncbi:S8 family serine peptidase [Reinekea forsetii]|nr:S8 family serine peptidase [Reinekea forsetii]
MSQSRAHNVVRTGLKSAVLAVTLGTAIISSQAFAQSSVTTGAVKTERPVIEKTIKQTPSTGFKAFGVQSRMMSFAVAEPTERYIISLRDPSVARYRGGINGYEATSTEGKSKLEVNAPHVQNYANYLETTQDKFLAQLSTQVGRMVTPLEQLQLASNVLIIELTEAEAQKAASIQGVRKVQKDQLFQLESTESLTGYAVPVDNANASVWAITAFTLVLMFGLTVFAWRRGWVGRKSATFVAIAASFGMAGCFYEGGFQWIGAPQIWHGTAGLEPTRGEGVVVGVIDTGINPISDSFAEVAGDGYRHSNPKGQYFGVCDPASEVYDATFPCNDKLIGAWGVPFINEGSPRDQDGHGSHTAGTSAGNLVYNATVSAPTGFEISKTISGVSPRSNVIAYTVCGDAGCYLSAILFAINQAILDGVDVINYSIGGGSSDPWADNDSLSFLAAMDAGIFVATSAGNSGPEFATVGSPGDAPWITTVAASSHDYLYKNSVTGLTNDQGDSLPEMIGQSIAPGFGPAAIVDAADYGNPLCLEGQFTSKFEGEIVLCELGAIARVAKGTNVAANGGSAVIVARPPRTPDGSGYFETDAHTVPATQITFTDFTTIREWLQTGSGHVGNITGTEAVLASEYADVMAYFSSRGVNPSVPSIVKPNITAPGRAIFAAFHEGYSEAEQDYNIIQGTSMSSPHIAGAGALLTALHPDWTPMQIQSAMMTTANLNHVKEDGVTQADPFDMGAGRIDLVAAANAALVLDETLDNFLAKDPYIGGKPSELNLTGLGEDACVVSCTWTRTVTNVSDKTTRWKSQSTDHVSVAPKHFRLAPGESQTLTFTADASRTSIGDWLFDQVVIKSKTRHVPDAHFPVAALSALSNLPGSVDVTAAFESDSVVLPGLKAVEITNAMVEITGLAKSEAYTGAVVSDPSNGDPFDGGFDPAVNGQEVFIVDVPAGATRFVAEITESMSGDLDLFVGIGSTPGFGTLAGYSAAGGSFEYVNIANPPAGQMWIVVQNWEPGHVDAQDYTVHAAVVTGDEMNLSVDMPTVQAGGVPFDATLNFNLPGSVSGDRFYGSFSVGTDAANAGNLGTVQVDLVRQ